MNVKYFLTFSFLEGSDSNKDTHKVNKSSLQPCTKTIINMYFVHECQDSKEEKSVSKR
jgi:hypothetical protein